MAPFSQITFSNAFSWTKKYIKLSLHFFPEGPINNIPSLVRIMAWRPPGDIPLSEPMTVSFLTHICVTRPQLVNYCCNMSCGQQVAQSEKCGRVVLYGTICHLVGILSRLTIFAMVQIFLLHRPKYKT